MLLWFCERRDYISGEGHTIYPTATPAVVEAIEFEIVQHSLGMIKDLNGR